ncbi:uncharacterized protein CDV56_103939 [Aspergillus thermomutatus]|uniref:C2H2-type domain-containing protein n=1 Tax=Aspergillus thermomutatus TaxID=41047 RepID=A0A397GHW5_ASPTH|nr:uncharacterized protein CDV56_103939 [Aspergillus thermomutatus]RHZ49046.1 hypothetical protein CDV56_103939 [Aspergillus thermomutatus]
MDLFIYNPTYEVWICTARQCQYAVSPQTLLTHLRVHHRSHATVATVALREAALTEMLKRPWIDPTKRSCVIPSPADPPIPGLPVYQGHGCPHCSYVARTTETIQKHHRETHRDLEPPCGRGRKPQWQAKASWRLANRVVSCQRLFPNKHGSQFFEVTCAATPPSKQALRATVSMTSAERIRACVDQALREGQAAAEIEDGQVPAIDPHPTAVSPWLELTRWPEYLRGQDQAAVALLGCLPDPAMELVLLQFSASIKRLIDQAYQVIKDGRLNEFNQIQINTFFRKPSVWNRPIQIHLRPATYHRYCQMEEHAQQLLDLQGQDQPVLQGKVQKQLDQACLALSIALLDHPLQGDLFDSTLVGFLAVLGVDPARQTFRDPYSYTSYLSGLVKMAQMLVALQAVRLAETGQVTHPADALDEMRERFLLYRMSMQGFRQFIASQVQLAQAELTQLFLLHEEEVQEEALPTQGERWLLDRVLGADWLREEFMEIHQIGQRDEVLWQEGPVDQYLQQVDRFLQRLLLLVHVTGGQPGRATELLTLTHSNTKHGRHRSNFIEHGLVSTVTTYHKGYSISNSTKIIHRYLPKAVSELVVYYLWLILPFCQSLQRLARGQRGTASPYLWPAGEGTWGSDRLRKILQQEAKTHLQTLSYRHAAIAISRVHLKCGGFKQDYSGTDNAAFNEQASHGSWIAGMRFFPLRTGSHYIQVRSPTTVPREPYTPAPANQTQAGVDEVMSAWEQAQAKADEVIQAGEITDANPWLRMTGWADYLQGIQANDLLACVAAPEEDTMDATEQGVQVIWDTMEQVARKSQQTVQHCGQAIWVEAVRSEKGQTPYRPLLAYMDEAAIQKHVHPWQQILAFIARTQAPHDWTSPKYGMTGQQRKKWQQLWQLAGQGPRSSPDPMDPRTDAPQREAWAMTDIKKACLEFCIELLNQCYRSHEYKSALVCAMAVLGQGETGWRDPESYPPILSRVIKIARFMVVQKALWMDPDLWQIIQTWEKKDQSAEWVLASADDTLGDIDEGYDSEDAMAPRSSPPTSSIHSDDPLPTVDMHRQGYRPFQEQVTWMMHYPGHVMWMGDDQLLYQQIAFTIGDFRGFIHGLVTAAQEILGQLCMQDYDQMPPIPWTALYDDPSQSQPGWNFLQDARTQWPVDGSRWMINQVRAEPAMQQQFMRGSQFHPPAIQQYWQRVAQFKEKLAIMVHVTAGQPARAPELLSIQHTNTANSMRRNIYMEDGMVTFATAYHKGFHATNDVKIIHRYVPREVGELVIWYIWLVMPFINQLSAWQASQTQTTQTTPTSEATEANPMGQTARTAQTVPITHHSAWLWGPNPGTGREWSSERFREALKRETRTQLGTAIHIAAYRDITIAISRRFLRPSTAFPHNIQEANPAPAAMDADAEEGMDMEQWIGHITDLQAAHSSHVAGMVYARDPPRAPAAGDYTSTEHHTASKSTAPSAGRDSTGAPITGTGAHGRDPLLAGPVKDLLLLQYHPPIYRGGRLVL